MTRDPDNPVGNILKLLRSIDLADDANKEMREPVTRYDLAEAMLLCANAQLAALFVNLPGSDPETMKERVSDFSASLAALSEKSVYLAGKPLIAKMVEQNGAENESDR
jgi:hypothetical protein